MEKLTLHIGAPKCGSSALQAALTANPVFKGRDGALRTYAAIGRDGAVLSGKEIVANKVFGYRSTVNFKELIHFPDPVFATARTVLERIDHPILSNEGLFVGHPHGALILGKIGLPVDVIAYVRPQVEYVNSAWWQWGAWAPMKREPWIEQRIKRSFFHNFLTAWSEIPQVRSVTVRLLPADVVSDFLQVIGVDPSVLPETVRTNSSLPGSLLRLIQRNIYLHHRYKGQLDFVLPREVAMEKLGKAPWVIDQALAHQIVERARPGNLKLLDMLDAESAVAMRDDPRWWDATFYADRPVEPFEPPVAASPETEQLAIAMMETILAKAAE